MIKNKILLGIFFFFNLISVYSCSKDKDIVIKNSSIRTAKVVGYLSTDNFDKIKNIQFCKLTHLNLAFANPDKQGNLICNGDVDGVIKYVKSVNPNIIICISVAGGVLTTDQATNWRFLIDNKENRPALIQSTIDFVTKHQLDGVDVDLEWDAVTIGYSDYVLELRKSLTAQNKIMTAALPNDSRFENITQEALNSFDFLNIMSYDSTGPWNPNNPGQHSSYENSKLGIEFWNKLQKVPKDKLILGVPFYGYDFTNKEVTSITYAQIVSMGHQFANKDENGSIFYNGRLTIEKKVAYASENVGGVMIWEIAQDSFDEYSLLDIIHKKYIANKIKTTGLCGN